MKTRLIVLGIAAVIAGAWLLAGPQTTFAKEKKVLRQDIADDTQAIHRDITDLATDTAEIRADRQAVRDALKSGDQEKLKEARRALHKALRERRKDKKELNSDRKDRREDLKELNK